MRRLNIILAVLLTAVLLCSCDVNKIGYYGDDISGQVAVSRDKATKEAELTISTGNTWRVYAGDRVETIDMTKPILKGSSDETASLPVSNTQRSYFQIVSNGNGVIAAERLLPMEGGYNFRDMGGYRTKDGRHVKWGKLFRTDDMQNLTDPDLEYLASTGIVSVVDFRSSKEMEEAPDKLPASVANHYPYAISPGNMSSYEELSRASAAQMEKYMQQMNVQFVSDPEIIAAYRKFFALLQDEAKVPLSFHCSAGKDRTGMAAALILYALGVDEETILEDYMLSNVFLTAKYKDIVEQYPRLKPMFEVRPEFLNSGIRYIKEKHGSVENYIANVLEVDIAGFREMYLD